MVRYRKFISQFLLLIGVSIIVICLVLLWSRRQTSTARLIAHSDFWDGTSDIYLHVPSSHYYRNITQHPAYDTQPTWSPDGRWIAFVSDRENRDQGRGFNSIYVMRPDGSQLHKVGLSSPATGTRVIAWSPDSQWLYAKYITQGWWDNYFVRVADADEQDEPISLRFDNNFTVSSLWSPGEAVLAYRTVQDDDSYLLAIVEPRADVQDTSAMTQELVHIPHRIFEMAWSFDGQWLAYTTLSESDDTPWHLNIISTNNLVDSPIVLPVRFQIMGNLVWSPHENTLVFIAAIETEDSEDTLQTHLYQWQVGASSAEILVNANEGFGVRQVAWSPDGSQFVYTVVEEAEDPLYRANKDGTTQTLIYNLPQSPNRLAWSDDGEWIYYTTGNREQEQLYQIRPDGSDNTYLTDTAFSWSLPISPLIDMPWRVWTIGGLGFTMVAVGLLMWAWANRQPILKPNPSTSFANSKLKVH